MFCDNVEANKVCQFSQQTSLRAQCGDKSLTMQETSDEKENYFFRVAEAIFVGWFSLEYLVRQGLICC